jgi:hypothetical protein
LVPESRVGDQTGRQVSKPGGPTADGAGGRGSRAQEVKQRPRTEKQKGRRLPTSPRLADGSHLLPRLAHDSCGSSEFRPVAERCEFRPALILAVSVVVFLVSLLIPLLKSHVPAVHCLRHGGSGGSAGFLGDESNLSTLAQSV